VGKMWTPRNIKQQCDNEKFDKFIGSPLYSFSSERHRKSEVNDYLQSLEVEGKVSVLMGLAAASAKYGHHEETSSKQEVISLSSSVFARKGFLSASKETVLCSDKGMSFYVDSIEIGMEEILIVSMAHKRDERKIKDNIEVKVQVFFFTISSKMENIQQSSSQRGFVRIDHYSSKTGKWEEKEFNVDQYKEALTEVQQIEEQMHGIANIVRETPNDELPHLRYVLRPCVKTINHIPLFNDLYDAINRLEMVIANLKVTSKDTAEFEQLENLLCTLQSLTVENCSRELIAEVKRKIRNWKT